MGADRDLTPSVEQIGTLNAAARRILDKALARYDGPCAHAYADVVSAYISAPAGGREALFLAVAYRAVGVTPPSPDQTALGSRATSAPARFRPDLTEWMGRAFACPTRRFGS